MKDATTYYKVTLENGSTGQGSDGILRIATNLQ
jgi:hypothetical protein